MKTDQIHIRDPFIYADTSDKTYYLFATSGQNSFSGPAVGFDCYRSADLQNWDGPAAVFRPGPSFWATRNFWAPEVHHYRGKYYLFASFKADRRYRGTQILVSECVSGPYEPLTGGPVTPGDWECLDGTLHVDNDGAPWIVFCHEWVQVHNGAMCAMRLTDDLTAPKGRPMLLFSASEAPWVHRPGWPDDGSRYTFPTYITDGPFLYRTRGGHLLMLWSSTGAQGYAMGVARSETGTVAGPWRHDTPPLWAKDGGHGMIFRDFGGRLVVTFHMPNTSPDERLVLVEVEDVGDGIRLTNQECPLTSTSRP